MRLFPLKQKPFEIEYHTPLVPIPIVFPNPVSHFQARKLFSQMRKRKQSENKKIIDDFTIC